MTRAVLYTGDIFRQQPRGGITRYFIELIRRLERPSLLWAGLHMSEELGAALTRSWSRARVTPSCTRPTSATRARCQRARRWWRRCST
jgi:hypothetical protein